MFATNEWYVTKSLAYQKNLKSPKNEWVPPWCRRDKNKARRKLQFPPDPLSLSLRLIPYIFVRIPFELHQKISTN